MITINSLPMITHHKKQSILVQATLTRLVNQHFNNILCQNNCQIIDISIERQKEELNLTSKQQEQKQKYSSGENFQCPWTNI